MYCSQAIGQKVGESLPSFFENISHTAYVQYEYNKNTTSVHINEVNVLIEIRFTMRQHDGYACGAVRANKK